MLRAALASFLLLALGLACDSGPPGPAHVRFAHFVPDAPALDFCLKPDGVAAFGSPFVGGAGMSYPSMSSRTDVDAGTYSVRLVPGGATSCATSLNGLGDITGLNLDGDGTPTLALIGRLTGSGTPALTMQAYNDKTTPTPSGGVSLRGINVAPGSTAQDVGVVSGSGAGSLFQAFATGVGYQSASAYATISITPSATNVQANLAARDSTSQAVWASGVFNNVSDTGVYTLYVIGIPGQTSVQRPSLMLCSDNSLNCAQSP
jgi:Domain of unknown function (DUF4397)